ncbi:hypothetical protein ABTY96_03965 [Streptomyces sp. NPDC096057]|uniref:hypothetical protein n=1 Tax=Streptomyces sp. NPDC096057 TaxID=3155543 RepID=UPI00331D130E
MVDSAQHAPAPVIARAPGYHDKTAAAPYEGAGPHRAVRPPPEDSEDEDQGEPDEEHSAGNRR